MRITWLVVAATCCLEAFALHSSEVGVIDWHKAFVGVPLVNSQSTAPVFHRVYSKTDTSTRSVILTATQSNVLAALEPKDGALAWRHIFDDDDHILGFQRHGDVVAAVSGPGGAFLRVFDALAGHLLVEKRLHAPETGRLFEPQTLGTAIAFDGEDLLVLTNGYQVRRVNGTTGDVKWLWRSADQTSSVVYSKVLATRSTVYLLGLAKSFASYTLHVTSLAADSGRVLKRTNFPSSITGAFSDLVVLSDVVGSPPRVAWLEDQAVRSLALTPELNSKVAVIKGQKYKGFHDVGLSHYGYFVASADSGAGRVIKLAADGLQVVWEFADSVTSAVRTPSLYSGGLDVEGCPYIARVFWSHSLKLAQVHVYASQLAEGKGLVTGTTFPFQTNDHGIITHVAVDVANPEPLQVISRIVVTTSTGSVQMWQADQLQWAREESLSDIRVAEFVELPERKLSALGDDGDAAFGARLLRQIADARGFPQYAANFVRRFVTGSYASASSSVAPAPNASEPLARDTFGFRKVIVVATGHGKVYGLDSANGAVLWSRVFDLGWAAKVGGHIIPAKLFTIKAVGDGESPQVVVVTQRKADNGLVDTVLFHVDALTGEDARAQVDTKGQLLLPGVDAISGPVVEAHALRTDNGKVLILFDEFLQVHLYPNTDENVAAFEKALPHLRIPLKTGVPGHRRLSGHQIPSQLEFTGKHIAYPTWTLSLPPNEDIRAIIPRPADPVASLGKVLGNRTTMYKYLNPNVLAVTTGPPSTAPLSKDAACGVYVVDGAKGTVLYHALVPSANGHCDVKAAFVENWLVYHYYDADLGVVDQAKGYRVVSVEFYEGNGVDARIGSSDLSSASNKTTDVSVIEQSFIYPRGIRTLALTSTTYGISTKDIIIANEVGQIHSIARRWLDPRRPNRKPTNEEMEEWLIQYDALLPDDPKKVLSHNYQVAKTERIITSPALLESTSLVFAYGLDLFFTRVAPSNTFDVLSENFNKAQLVFTIAGLAMAILVVKPMVQRKSLRQRWYDS